MEIVPDGAKKIRQEVKALAPGPDAPRTKTVEVLEAALAELDPILDQADELLELIHRLTVSIVHDGGNRERL